MAQFKEPSGFKKSLEAERKAKALRKKQKEAMLEARRKKTEADKNESSIAEKIDYPGYRRKNGG